MNHTPGPWQVVGSNVYGNNFRALLPMNAADARLIAAAPDLLSALMMAVSALERSDYIQMDGDSFDVIEVSRAAIAKARGEK